MGPRRRHQRRCCRGRDWGSPSWTTRWFLRPRPKQFTHKIHLPTLLKIPPVAPDLTVQNHKVMEHHRGFKQERLDSLFRTKGAWVPPPLSTEPDWPPTGIDPILTPLSRAPSSFSSSTADIRGYVCLCFRCKNYCPYYSRLLRSLVESNEREVRARSCRDEVPRVRQAHSHSSQG